jgi:peptide/nickel transport system ATP-binding protein/oligopeptide transport system ATP-binding protein
MAGEVLFNSEDLLKYSDEKMLDVRGNEISMIFQEPMTALNPVLRIGEQIGEVLEVHGNVPLKSEENRRRCIQLLEMVRIPRAEKLVDEYPHQLSGGMRQRVMIAMALSCNPRLLIADEPTTALDVTIQAQVLDLTRKLKAELGTAMLFITHDLGVIAEIADDVAVMYAGKIVEQADVRTLFREPTHPYTIGLMRSRPAQMQPGEPLYCIPGMVPAGEDMPVGCAFAPRCASASDECRRDGEIPLTDRGGGHLVRCLHAQGGTSR